MYALIQDEFRVFDVGSVTKVYMDALSILAPDAAQRIRQSPAGILALFLEETEASALQEGLASHGIGTAILAMDRFFPLPDFATVNNATPTDAGFEIKDFYERITVVPWETFQYVNAAIVCEHQAMIDEETEETVQGEAFDDLITNSDFATETTKTTTNYYLEIFGEHEMSRLRIRSSKFNYSCLGEVMQLSADLNFRIFLELIIDYCGDHCKIDASALAITGAVDEDVETFDDDDLWRRYNHWAMQFVTNDDLFDDDDADGHDVDDSDDDWNEIFHEGRPDDSVTLRRFKTPT